MREELQDAQETLVAPHEVRALLERLTASSVESIPVDEPRTLAGLAAQTGIPLAKLEETLRSLRKPSGKLRPGVILAMVGAIVISLTAFGLYRGSASSTPLETTPVVEGPKWDVTGLVPITKVTYGPDSGPMVDPTFEPSVSLPKGLSTSITIDGVLWGAGDHHAGGLHTPMSSEDEAKVRLVLRELIDYVRQRAAKRGLKPTASHLGVTDPSVDVDGLAYLASIEVYTAAGFSRMTIRLPVSTDDPDTRRVTNRAIDGTLTRLRQTLDTLEQVRQRYAPH